MNQPIGVIDSGVGGITVAKEIIRQLPNEEIIYLGDTLRCPYGPRSSDEVRMFTWRMIRHLIQEDIKMLVIACNTATAVAFEEIRNSLPIPVIGVVHPGARTAMKVTRHYSVGIIGTSGTIRSQAYNHALETISDEVSISSMACPPFVPLVESGELTSDRTRTIVSQQLAPLKDKEIDTLILGCTHYPLLRPMIQEVMGDDIKLIDSGEETAREISTILYHKGLLADHHKPNHRFYTTGAKQMLALIASQWLHVNPNVKTVQI
ncbi:glutamate racemase [Tuberibacillus sp. Marseille-P3662]|uniref:glutamate racemase n=1 Tax=Tuberibacillus sp. Marseille-P3662 TaxID=1965358 RepID=UPI000A1CF06E|nr:glutamate racemase [Tuberibacillus sp. Marseille-P3662]